MPAIRYSELKQNWEDLIEDDRFTINYNAKIHDSVRLEPYSLIEEDVEIGENCIIGPFVQLRAGIKIGKNCHIGGHCTFEGKGIIIGDNVRVGTHVCIPFNTIIEDNVFLGNGAQLSNDKYIDWPATKAFEPQQTRICKGAKIGVGCTLLPGITIGEKVVVGAGSVVTKSITRGTTVWGNPAKDHIKLQKEMNEILKNTELKIEKITKQLYKLDKDEEVNKQLFKLD
jgi:acetyltransferase-like isoleucine patch superfamily enzyme